MESPQNEELFARALRVTPGGVHSPVRALKGVGRKPLFVSRASGPAIFDCAGREYTDYCMSFGPLIFGHADPLVRAAVSAALERGWSFGAADPVSLALAELISDRIPWAEQIRFMNSGTEAVMTALRVARAASGRDGILKFEGCYHGHSDAMLIRAGSGLAEQPQADSAGIPKNLVADTLVTRLDDDAALETVFAEHAERLAAAIIEPLPANYGLLPQRQAFLERLRDLCRRHAVLLIFDEVITGFRVAFGGMAELTDVTPDLLTYGKVIGGGFPVGAVAGRPRP